MFKIFRYEKQKIKNTFNYLHVQKNIKTAGFTYLNQRRNTRHISIYWLLTHVSQVVSPSANCLPGMQV